MAGIIGFNNYSSNYYTKGVKPTAVPFSKFQWTIIFGFAATAEGAAAAARFENITYIAQKVDLPSWDIDTQTLNQYNKQRAVNTKVTLKSCTITFLDTVDNKFRDFILTYLNQSSNSFGLDGANAIKNHDLISDQFDGKYGQKAVKNDDAFIQFLQINQEHGGKVTPVQLLRPKITSVSRDSLEYTATTGLVQWTITLQPEGILHLPVMDHPDYKFNIPGAVEVPKYRQKPTAIANGVQQGPLTQADTLAQKLNLGQATSSVNSAMNNVVKNVSSSNNALTNILSNPGGSITTGTAINGSSIGSIIGSASAGASSVLGPIASIGTMAGALTQIPGLRKYAGGPLGQLAQAGYKLRSVNNMIKTGPAAVSSLQKYINGFDPKRLGGGWL